MKRITGVTALSWKTKRLLLKGDRGRGFEWRQRYDLGEQLREKKVGKLGLETEKGTASQGRTRLPN